MVETCQIVVERKRKEEGNWERYQAKIRHSPDVPDLSAVTP
jgi:hypothetical protein